MLDIVVPSAHPRRIVDRTFPALGRAASAAGLDPGCVTIVDERPDREGLAGMVEALGFRRLETGGIGNGAARNRGAAVGTAPWILFLDDDVELDAGAVESAVRIAGSSEPTTVTVGGMRPPMSDQRWWAWTYSSAAVNQASALADAGERSPLEVAVTLVLVPRELFDGVGGFPELDEWGWIDLLFGLRLRNQGPDELRVVRDPSISGTHWYEPTWEQWLGRMEQAGGRLAEVLAGLPQEDVADVLKATGFAGVRVRVKQGLGVLPLWRHRPPPLPALVRAVSGGAMARGMRRSRA